MEWVELVMSGFAFIETMEAEMTVRCIAYVRCHTLWHHDSVDNISSNPYTTLNSIQVPENANIVYLSRLNNDTTRVIDEYRHF